MSLEARAAVLVGYFALVSWTDLLWPAVPWVPAPRAAWTQEPDAPVPPDHNHPPQTPQAPCTSNPTAACVVFTMVIDNTTRWFTAEDLGGREPATLDESLTCVGHWTSGSLRYFTNGTAPSSLVGTLVPGAERDADGNVLTDPEHTLEDSGLAILLYNRSQLLGFKATAANSNPAELGWECAL
jgi:hypothetical protein